MDSDPIIQMFPRCVWANEFHTSPLADRPAITDLITRARAIRELDEPERRDLVELGTVDQRFPVSLMPLAKAYENDVAIDLIFRDQEDPKTRYEAFWKLFRATSIRWVAWQQGDQSAGNLLKIADNSVKMSAAMLETQTENGQTVVLGDLAFAEQCAETACTLLANPPDLLLEQAERQLADIQRVRRVIAAHPDRFVLRPRYGPFPVREADFSPGTATDQS